MIRLRFSPPGSAPRSVALDGDLVRFGSDPGGEVCLAAPADGSVAALHGHLVRNGQAYRLEAFGPECRLWVDGTERAWAVLRGGERIRVGSPNGPELRVQEISFGPALGSTIDEEERTEKVGRAQLLETMTQKDGAPGTMLHRALAWMKEPHAEVRVWLSHAEREIRRARSKSQGGPSGDTMVIMASALTGLRQSGEGRLRRWRRTLFALAGLSLALLGAMGAALVYQQQRIQRLVSEKAAVDGEIQTVLQAMDNETDLDRLSALEARLQELVGDASQKLLEVKKRNERRAQELAEPADPLEADIRKILHSFNADTYAIPPIFRQTLQRHVEALSQSPNLKSAYARKARYWPVVQRALHRHQLPVELGYIAYTESGFDPSAKNPRSGAAGMWQFMEAPARECGLRVSPELDERFDPARSSQAAGCHLSRLLVEFGEESFMLALASYNRGENGVRASLHKLAAVPGGYRQRDFWHLYRLKLLPPETREYVPKVLAAAIVLGSPQRYGLAP